MDTNGLKANFSVSNTDVITMLVVKNRELLQKQRAEQSLIYNKGIEHQSKDIFKKWQKYIAKKFEKNEVIETYEKLLKLLNPKAKFTLDLGSNMEERIGQNVSYQYNGWGSVRDKEGNPYFFQEELKIYPIFEQNDEGYNAEENFHYIYFLHNKKYYFLAM